MNRKLKVAAIQMDAGFAPVSERLKRAANLITEAVRMGARLVVLPEMFNTGYEFHERNYQLAEPLDGETITWMKAQAVQHHIHLAGSLLLLDDGDIYNSGFLVAPPVSSVVAPPASSVVAPPVSPVVAPPVSPVVAPNGRIWRHDKINITLWERAYFRESQHQCTIADTDLGKIGLLICSDVLRPDLWVGNAGKVDAMIVMFSPGNTSQAKLNFPDGYQIDFDQFVQAVTPPNLGSYPSFEVMQKYIAWMPVPMVFAGGTGVVNTRLPGLKSLLQNSRLSDRTSQASDVWLELPFSMGTMIGEPKKGMLAHGTTMGDKVISAEIEIAEMTPQQPEPQPDVPPFHTNTFDYYVARLMLPLYRDGLRRYWGSNVNP